MGPYHVVLIACCFLPIATAGFPKATTIFTDVTKPYKLIRSSAVLTKTWQFEKEYDLSGVFIGSRHSDDVWGEPPSEEPLYMESLTVFVTEHNGTYLAPQTEVGIGHFAGLVEYNSTIFIPLKGLRDGEDVPRVRPISDEHTLYYISVAHNVPVPGWYPFYNDLDIEFFGAFTHSGVPDYGVIVGIEYSKPTDLE